jgi:hypothetical protein
MPDWVNTSRMADLLDVQPHVVALLLVSGIATFVQAVLHRVA